MKWSQGLCAAILLDGFYAFSPRMRANPRQAPRREVERYVIGLPNVEDGETRGYRVEKSWIVERHTRGVVVEPGLPGAAAKGAT
jgi:hypothetical protein